MDDNDRRGYQYDAENGQSGNNFPLSQMSFVSGDDFRSNTICESDEVLSSNIQRNNTGNSITSTSGNRNTNLQRKPSFLDPESHYDGGGFQFMSGLSQE